MAAKEKKAEEEPAEAVEGEEGGGKVKGKRKLIIIIAAVVLLAVVGAVVALTMGGGDKKDKKTVEKSEKKGKKDEKALKKTAFYTLPKFLVNLSTGTGKTSFLNMTVTLELRDLEAKKVMDANKPRILDTLNTYLRELRPTDLGGSAGMYRLKEELTRRLNATVEKGIVKDVLINDIIVQ